MFMFTYHSYHSVIIDNSNCLFVPRHDKRQTHDSINKRQLTYHTPHVVMKVIIITSSARTKALLSHQST